MLMWYTEERIERNVVLHSRAKTNMAHYENAKQGLMYYTALARAQRGYIQ